MIEIPTKVHQVDKYLREMCQKLSACPNLVSTAVYEDVCPSDCHNRPKAEFKVTLIMYLKFEHLIFINRRVSEYYSSATCIQFD